MEYSKQIFYCRGCGVKMNIHINQIYSYRATVCGLECGREVKWRETLSIMNKEYSPKKENTAL